MSLGFLVSQGFHPPAHRCAVDEYDHEPNRSLSVYGWYSTSMWRFVVHCDMLVQSVWTFQYVQSVYTRSRSSTANGATWMCTVAVQLLNSSSRHLRIEYPSCTCTNTPSQEQRQRYLPTSFPHFRDTNCSLHHRYIIDAFSSHFSLSLILKILTWWNLR